MIFCTLFDSYYLDKGLVMFESLKNITDDFKLYVIAFDDKCYDILKDYNDEKLIPISLKEFESEELLRVKKTRTRGEYCWTCSSHAIAYIIDNYEEVCTYIDADMYFYDNPKKVLDEMFAQKSDTQIIEQRFDNRIISREMMRRSGKYCVEFNTFNKNKNSRGILQWWQDRCIESCTVSADGKVFGDQKYLDDWLERFEGVSVVKNIGAGVAPWNIVSYDLIVANGDNIELLYKPTGQRGRLVFYHFHNVSFIDNGHVNIEVYSRANNTSEKLVNTIYIPYLRKIIEKRKFLSEKYNIDYSAAEKHPTSFSSVLKTLSFKGIIGKLRGYTPIGLLEFVWYKKNKKQDIIDVTEI